jgi:hypothetical protein
VFDQASYEDGFARIAKAFEKRGPKTPVAHKVGSDGADDHTNHKRWTDAPIGSDEDANSNT